MRMVALRIYSGQEYFNQFGIRRTSFRIISEGITSQTILSFRPLKGVIYKRGRAYSAARSTKLSGLVLLVYLPIGFHWEPFRWVRFLLSDRRYPAWK